MAKVDFSKNLFTDIVNCIMNSWQQLCFWLWNLVSDSLGCLKAIMYIFCSFLFSAGTDLKKRIQKADIFYSHSVNYEDQCWSEKFKRKSYQALNLNYLLLKIRDKNLLAQNRKGTLPVATERAWLMWPNKLFRGRACTYASVAEV